ncbi:hypothetical protein CAEBREN_21021 [Caenorhabditis brenneri]|uniref:MAT1 centre domain-containing protein n=1 Tax=Caenorhabditis brenneri TaxID=135651 RepID=G0P354_CAEBE|nr:hypothetical protein CAEBREN_21021 [Caenorhabditis brenneri]
MNSGECHVCNRVLRKNNFREQIYDDPLIDKDTFLRRKLRKIYNLKQDDYATLKEKSGDYQERFETLVYNLVLEADVMETNAEISAFEEKNKELIDRNKTSSMLRLDHYLLQLFMLYINQELC